jgi:hypothetical protein
VLHEPALEAQLAALGWGDPQRAQTLRIRAQQASRRTEACFQSGACEAYAAQLHAAVSARWQVGVGVAAAGEVRIGLSLGSAAGEITYLRVEQAPSVELARSCVDAIRQLALPPPPPELVDILMIMHFVPSEPR